MEKNRPKKLSEKLLYIYQHARDHCRWGNMEKAILYIYIYIYITEPEKKMENLTLTERYLMCFNLL